MATINPKAIFNWGQSKINYINFTLTPIKNKNAASTFKDAAFFVSSFAGNV